MEKKKGINKEISKTVLSSASTAKPTPKPVTSVSKPAAPAVRKTPAAPVPEARKAPIFNLEGSKLSTNMMPGRKMESIIMATHARRVFHHNKKVIRADGSEGYVPKYTLVKGW